MSVRQSFSLVLLLRMLALAVGALMLLSGGRPAARGQADHSSIVSSEDAVQDSDIIAINRHLDYDDGRLDQQAIHVAELESQIAEMQGEERISFGVITALIAGGLVIQWRRRPA